MWFQVNRKEKTNSKRILISHLSGVSFRSIGNEHNFSASTAYRKYWQALSSLPHCADITRKYCSRFCGILLVDGKYIAVKGYKYKIPVIYGVDYLTHDIPTYIFSRAENYPTFYSFFSSLRLLNYPLQAVVSDDNLNIYQSATKIYPKAATQLCQNHYKERIRQTLSIRTDETYRPFVKEIEYLFGKRRSKEEFNNVALKIYKRYEKDDICKSILVDIQRRLPQLIAYTNIPRVPKTNNLIESFNSHLEGRLKTIKGFDSFKHADTWLNAYFIRRRLKPFTDCVGKFRYLNGKSSLEKTIKPNYKIDTILRLIR